MTWGEIRLRTVQLMFSNDGAALSADDNNQDYLNAMPGVANAGLNLLTQVGVPLRGQFTIVLSADASEPVEEPGKLTLPLTESNAYKIALPDYCPDFRALDPGQVFLERDGDYRRMQDWRLENDRVLVIDGTQAGTITLYYHIYPATITASTSDDTELNVTREAAELLPLYIAGELYKDDDLAMATMFRNEFEDGLTKLQYARTQRSSTGSGMFRNTTGWY